MDPLEFAQSSRPLRRRLVRPPPAGSTILFTTGPGVLERAEMGVHDDPEPTSETGR